MRTKIWAHRGAKAAAPENTMAAFKLAMEQGADGVELDIHLSRDGEMVVIHDETLDRTSDGSGEVDGYTLKELKGFDMSVQHPGYGKQEIPTLREVLQYMKPTGAVVNIELKTDVKRYPGIEEKAAQLVKELGMEPQVIFSSFYHGSVEHLKKLDPGWKSGLLYEEATEDMVAKAKDMGVEAIHPDLREVNEKLVEACRANGIKIHVWTVNREEDIRRLIDMGVDAVITDVPDLALDVLKNYDGTQKRNVLD